MAQQEIDIGAEGNDGTGDSIRESFKKVNENFQELYAVFGKGGQIGFDDLSDTPENYFGSENKIPVVKQTSDGLEFRELASNSDLDGSPNTIGFDYSVAGKIILKQEFIDINLDKSPEAGGPIDMGGNPIANIGLDEDAVIDYNRIHTEVGQDPITIDDLVINKRFADLTYQKKFTVGGGIRLQDEPSDTIGYSFAVDSLTTGAGDAAGNFTISDHGFSQDFNGVAVRLESENILPIAIDSSGIQVNYDSNTEFFLHVRDADTVSLHPAQNDAILNSRKIKFSGGTGPFSLVDADFNEDLAGNWLDSVPLPRKSAVRRQGDAMTGALTLHDHPGSLRGAGTPSGDDDLQAATKLYVDKITSESDFQLYVSPSGNDTQSDTPFGSEGRSPAYAYRTVNAACRKAEELIILSDPEPGPYIQDITFGAGRGQTKVITSGFENPDTDRIFARNLLEQNKNFIAAETVEYVRNEYPALEFSASAMLDYVKLVIESIGLDIIRGDFANQLSKRAGFKFFDPNSEKIFIQESRRILLEGLDHARDIIADAILTNTAVDESGYQLYQTRFTQFANASLTVDSITINVVRNKFNNTIKPIITNGILLAEPTNDGVVDYEINLSNGGLTNVDQADPDNIDIIPGKVIRGKTSGAIGQITQYVIAGERTDGSVHDLAKVKLLTPVEFIVEEPLEYGNIVKNTQISVRIESGVYEEDFPIRVPANVSIKGDEFRRCIIRPKDRRSQSFYSDLFFYRDREFDNLVIGKSSISGIGEDSSDTADSFVFSANPLRVSAAGTYTITDTEYQTNGFGKNAEFEVVVAADGSATVTVMSGGEDFRVDDRIIILDDDIGASGEDNLEFKVTKVPNGVEYINPLTGTVDGYFGRHYLSDPSSNINVSQGFINVGGWNTQSQAVNDNLDFLVEQTVEFFDSNYSGFSPIPTRAARERHIADAVEAIVKDLEAGGQEFALEMQGKWFDLIPQYNEEIQDLITALDHLVTIIRDILLGQQPTTLFGNSLSYPVPDLFFGDTTPETWTQQKLYRVGDVVSFTDGAGTRVYQTDTLHESGLVFDQAEIARYWNLINLPQETVSDLVGLMQFAFDSAYNPPLNNKDLDVFLMNDGTILRNITVQAQGGFMCVLDPEGQILTRSPYIQTGSSFSQSINKQAFRGGLFVDAFCGNSAVQVLTTGVPVSGFPDTNATEDPFVLQVQSLPDQGLFFKRPETPCAFYIDGKRFQVNAVTRYDQTTGTAVLILDPSSNDGRGFTGSSNLLLGGVDLDSATPGTPIDITLQTAGNRSMLGNDFTQINDLGYGLVCVNGALSEMVSMFTYYCHASYYAKNGSEIRSLTGSSCYGEFGLVAEGADPNEVPDTITLERDLVVAAKTFSAQIIIELDEIITVTEGETITQPENNAAAVVVKSTQGRYIYLTDVQNVFTTNEQLIDGSSTAVTANIVDIDVSNYENPAEQLFVYAYDFVDPPSNSAELDLYHPGINRIDRYQVTSVERVNSHAVNSYNVIDDSVFDTSPASGSGAVFNLYGTRENGYVGEITDGGSGYTVGDTFVVTGPKLGGAGTGATIIITSVDNNDSTSGEGVITGIEVSGAPLIDDATPQYSGIIYKLNFSTGDADFSSEGLSESVGWGQFIDFRRNSKFIIDDINGDSASLTIRPSTALVFEENPEFVYRSISFEAADSVGELLDEGQAAIGIDATFDYIRLIVNETYGSEPIGETYDTTGLVPLSGGTTKGGTQGDEVIAVLPNADTNEVYRLNNNARTPIANRPESLNGKLSEAPIITWQGKKFYMFNYRAVEDDGSGKQVIRNPQDTFLPGALYALVDIEETGETINTDYTGDGLPSSIVIPGETITIRGGIAKESVGDITINISTCRATGHDFLNVGTGSFNTSNYPSVIFGAPRSPDQTKEVAERGKGRVFYVSTDQNGIFRVGKFFSVDQGTGTVSFAASIALSNVDGIGFRRGVTITEFSTDSSMTDNAADSVPTESAVRGYVDRRIGYDINGTLVPNPLGPSVLAANGSVPLSDDLDANLNRISNLEFAIDGRDATNKNYVDDQIGRTDALEKLNDTTLSDVQEAQLLVASGYKRIGIDASTIQNGPFAKGDVFTGSETGATGEVYDIYPGFYKNGAIVNLIYIPLSGEINLTATDTISVSGGAEGVAVDGPDDEWMNGVYDPASDIEFSVSRSATTGDRTLTLRVDYKTNSIINADVNANAAIAQSKLDMEAASTRGNALSIDQTDLGLAAFKDDEFSATDGFIELKTATSSSNGVQLEKLGFLENRKVLGRLDDGGPPEGPAQHIDFNNIVDVGGGLLHTDIPDNDTGAITRTGAETYDITGITTVGADDSIVKTTNNGSVQVQKLIVGPDTSFKILDVSGTTVSFTTPGQGTVFNASGDSTNVKIRVGGDVDLIGDGVSVDGTSDSQLKQNSTSFQNSKSLASRWIYSSFIEAPDEKNAFSSGVSIGAGTGITQEGEVAVFVADVLNNFTRSPFIFDKNGVRPDEDADTDLTGYNIGGETDRYNTVFARNFTGGTFNTEGILPNDDNTHNIGASDNKYNTVYATLFNGTALEAYYADLAENYAADKFLDPGTVVIIGGDAEITECTVKDDHKVVGIVSSNPAYLMNKDQQADHVTAVALQGRLLCKVIGKVERGDMLVTSAVPGHAMVNNDAKPGRIIGKALESKDTNDRGVIEVLVGKH